MDLTSLLIWIILGAVAGWLAGLIVKGRGFGTLGNIFIGILGSFIGGWIGSELGIAGATIGGLNLPSILTAFGGAVVVLVVISLLRRAT